MITTVENYLIEKITELFSGRLRLVDSLPGQLDQALIKAMAVNTPAVYVTFLGGRSNNSAWVANWGLYVSTGLGDHKLRRQGDARIIGAYEIINLLISYFDDHTVPEVGSFSFERVQNLFNLKLDSNGVSVYGITLNLPMPFDDVSEADGALQNFITYRAEHSLVPGDDEPTAIDEITLDQ
ncbi:MAG TPA: phage protein Gp37 [Gammaproteobacteria bacterium]